MKYRVLAVALLIFSALPLFAHSDPRGTQITTKSPRAHKLFEQGLNKVALLHFQAGLADWREAAQTDPHFALAHIYLAFFSQDPAEQLAERDKALATRQYAGPEEQLIIDWIANASQGRLVPAILSLNDALERYKQDKYLAWLAG